MFGLIIFFVFVCNLFVCASQQSLSLCYYNKERVTISLPDRPNFMKSVSKEVVDKGFLVFYERKAIDLIGFLSLHYGCDFGKWQMQGDGIFSTSLFLSGRMWMLHLLFLHTYIEYSLFSPTILSKKLFGSVNFGSNFLFQSFYGMGIEFGERGGFFINIKAIKYSKISLSKSNCLFHAPIMVSFGVLF